MRLLMVAAILALLALDWAALDDMTTGSEPNLRLEYAMVGASLPLLAMLGRMLQRRPERDEPVG